jgi:hypothetical protein
MRMTGRSSNSTVAGDCRSRARLRTATSATRGIEYFSRLRTDTMPTTGRAFLTLAEARLILAGEDAGLQRSWELWKQRALSK